MCRGCTLGHWDREYPWLREKIKEVSPFYQQFLQKWHPYPPGGPIEEGFWTKDERGFGTFTYVPEYGSTEYMLLGQICILSKELEDKNIKGD